MRAGKVALLVVGVVLALVGLGLALAGGTLAWLHAFGRGDDGYFASSAERFATPTRAITSDDVDLGGGPGEDDWVPFEGELGTVRFDVDPAREEAVFVGIAATADVERYLDGVAHEVVVDGAYSPGAVRYRVEDGDRVPAPPAAQDIWVASATGTGPQELRWDVESGNWSVVVMQADGGRGVDVDAIVAVKVGWLLAVGAALGVLGLALLVGGTWMVVAAVRSTGPAGAPAYVAPGRPGAYPLRLDARLDEPLSRGLWLVKWFLAIPHLVVLAVLWIAVVFATIAAFFAILVTGRYPRSLFDFNVGVLRWTWRVAFYAFAALGTDRYPPFSLAPDPTYPADLVVVPPAQLSRGLVLVKWWLLALPQYLVVAVLAGGFGLHLGGALSALVLVAAIVLLASGAYPRDLFGVVLGVNRWAYRVLAYAMLMTDEYPPFRFDGGGEDPGTLPPPAPTSPAQPTAEPPAEPTVDELVGPTW